MGGMTRLRWWDLAAWGIAIVIAGLALIQPPYGPDDAGVWVGTAAFLIVYALLGRPVLVVGDDGPILRQAVAFTALALVLGAGSAADQGFATLQTFIYPFVWVTARNLRVVLVEHVVVAAAVVGGYVAGGGVDAVGWGLLSAALATVFSLAFGLWVTSMVRQGFERSRLLDELQAAQGALAAANREHGVEMERARMAREIHDTIAQSLTGLVMVAQRARRGLDKPGSAGAVREDLDHIESLARESLAEARTLVAATAAPDRNAGLRASIERVAASFARETGLAVDTDLAEVPALDREHEVVLLRSVQEGLANVRKHAGASRARVSLSVEDAAVRVRVEDDGRGPAPAGSAAAAEPDETVASDAAGTGSGGFGLAGLRDRVGLVGGTLDFGPGPAGGARLDVQVPRERTGDAGAQPERTEQQQ